MIVFHSDNTVEEKMANAQFLSMQPRDLAVFTSSLALTAQKALIRPRYMADTRMVLFRTEAARVVIYSDRAVMFPAG